MKKVTVKLKPHSYDIIVGKGVIRQLPQLLKKLLPTPKIVLITSRSIGRLYGIKIGRLLRRKGFAVSLHYLPEGETAKSQSELFKIYHACLKAGLDRSSGILAIGGGAVGDVAGFAASTYLRGIPFINVPTTLLAQVDSAIGGKTAINLREGKNLVGTFYQPRLVVSDLDLLKSLPSREYKSSLAEIIKYGVITSPTLFRTLERQCKKILKRDTSVLEKIILESAKIKARVVEQDEREVTGKRAMLNYGHTFAHAYEKVAGFGEVLHGEAVAIGMAEAARLASSRGLLTPATCKRIIVLIEKLGLPATGKRFRFSKARICEAMVMDKKKKGDKIYFVLPERIGKVKRVPIVIKNLKSIY